MFRLRVFGPPAVTEADTGERVALPVGKPLALLYLVALEPTDVARDDLASLLWPGSDTRRARASVRQALWTLRQALGDDIITEDERGLAVNRDRIAPDVEDFEELLREERLDDAWERWCGGPLQGFAVGNLAAWQRWVDELQDRWALRFGQALELAARDVAGERRAELLDRAVEVRPFSESAHRARIETLLELGRIEDAERALTDFQRAGIATASTVQDLQARLASGRRARFESTAEPLAFDFVGRAEEFSTLVRLWRASERSPAAAVILGPGGIGKTRLADEFAALVEGEGGRVVESRGIYAERTLSLGGITALAKDLLTQDGSPGISAGSHDLFGRLVPSVATSRVPQGAPPTEAAIADALADLIDAVAAEGPLVLRIEDAQWIDASSRRILARVIRTGRGAGVMWVVTSRPLETGGLPVIEGESAFPGALEVLRLRPLALGEVREALGFMFGLGGPVSLDRAAEVLHGASGGNPFFLLELLHGFRELGIVHPSEHAETGWVLERVPEPDSIALPGSVREALRTRIRNLSSGGRRMLETLAATDHPVRPGELTGQARLRGSEGHAAIQELLERDLVRWARDDRLDLSHDFVRETLREGPRRRRARWSLRVAGVAVAVAGVAALTMIPGGGAETGDLGLGGVIFVESGVRLVQYDVESREGRPALEVVDTLVVPDGLDWSGRPAMGADGRWHIPVSGNPDLARAPDAFLLFGDSLASVWRTPGDDNVGSVATRARFLLLTTEHPDTSWFRMQLARLDLETGEMAVIGGGAGEWRLDGRWILEKSRTTLRVIRPDGSLVASLPDSLGDLKQSSWCGLSDRVVLVTLPPAEGPTTWIWNVSEGEVSRRPTVRPLTDVGGCSPDGSSLLYVTRSEGRTEVVVEPIEGGDAQTLLAEAGVERVFWTSADVGLAPSGIEIVPDRIALERGESHRVAHSVLGIDSIDAERLEWLSSDPLVVSSGRGGTLTANGPGRAVVHAVLDRLLRDSVEVTVREGSRVADVIFSDPMVEVDSTRWHVVGFPAPRSVELEDGTRQVSMEGDGSGTDGVLSKEAFDLQQGATAEIDFWLDLDRPDKQQFRFCLYDAEPFGDGATLGAWSVDDSLCFSWPADELELFDPTEVRFQARSVPMGAFQVERPIRTDGWNRVAIQIRADGEVELYLNGVRTARLVRRLPGALDRRWRVGILGRAYETRLLVRNLSVLSGLRYADGGG